MQLYQIRGPLVECLSILAHNVYSDSPAESLPCALLGLEGLATLAYLALRTPGVIQRRPQPGCIPSAQAMCTHCHPVGRA